MKVKVPWEVVRQARRFAEQVHNNRAGNKDKFLTGKEAAMDVKGFEVEFCHAFAFKQPFPAIFSGTEVDKYDALMVVPTEAGLLKLMKFDLKTSKDFLINKQQMFRKGIDAYLFETVEFLGEHVDHVVLHIHGWIEKKHVVSNSEFKEFRNGSQAYSVNKAALQNPKRLFALNQPQEYQYAKKKGPGDVI